MNVLMLTVTGIMNSQSIIFYAISCGGSAAHFAWQIWTLKEDVADDAMDKFKSNVVVGCLVLNGITLDLAYKRHQPVNAEEGEELKI